MSIPRPTVRQINPNLYQVRAYDELTKEQVLEQGNFPKEGEVTPAGKVLEVIVNEMGERRGMYMYQVKISREPVPNLLKEALQRIQMLEKRVHGLERKVYREVPASLIGVP